MGLKMFSRNYDWMGCDGIFKGHSPNSEKGGKHLLKMPRILRADFFENVFCLPEEKKELTPTLAEGHPWR